MSRQIFLRKVQGTRIGFIPASRADEIELERLPMGRDLRADVVVPQSGPYHRMMMATFTLIASILNSGPTGRDWDLNKVRKRLLIQTGYADVDPLSTSTRSLYGFAPHVPLVHLEPRSMAFDAMEHDERVRFFEASMLYVLVEFGAWVKDHPDWQEVQNIGAKLRLVPQEVAA